MGEGPRDRAEKRADDERGDPPRTYARTTDMLSIPSRTAAAPPSGLPPRHMVAPTPLALGCVAAAPAARADDEGHVTEVSRQARDDRRLSYRLP